MTDLAFDQIHRDRQIGVIFVMLAAATWSTAGFFTRLIGLDYAAMIAGRGIFGGLGLFAIIVMTEGRNWPRLFTNMRGASLLYIVFVVAGMTAFVGSLGLTSVAHNAVIFATLPLMAGFLGWFVLRETPTPASVAAAGLALIGVAIMVGFGADGGLAGDALSVLSTLCMTLCIILIRRHPEISITGCACVGSLTSGLICLPFADLSAAQPPQLIFLVLFGLVNSAAGLTLFSLGSRKLPAMQTALISTLDTPLAPLWVWIAFQESVTPQTLIGGAIVLAAVIGNILWSRRAVG
ncbi:DMT family transporter [Rhizobium sp. TRM95796]|uniref:DMT family transporter n=1 Tax=Rhizobium sp. TRM95796 TaxID=2979862 RepID=UPI0021E6DD74|nr:DMT family transporter [Rhizobium sp. TRM95796]MCV3764425.1 DMT family transporter [Rhizobium sp. TRM95796]